MKKIIVLMILLICFNSVTASKEESQLDPYLDALRERGEQPEDFVLRVLDKHDLIIFDDALHTAVSPFNFYRELIFNPDFQKEVKYIFLEVVAVNQQDALDRYIQSDDGDISLLYPAFQNDFSGRGWPYRTYFDLLESVRYANSRLPAGERFRVIAVNAPVYWKEIEDSRDLELFRLSLAGNDYTMYRIILSYLDDFKSGEKGIFLTNTRHAYKGIKNREGNYFLNCGTFFHQRHPGSTYSIRFHNLTLSLKKKMEPDPEKPATTEGLERLKIEWVRMEEGIWDSAFREYGNRPVGLELSNTPFGTAGYIGNHMLEAASGQTIQDAYDGLIFLVPLERTRRTGMVDFIYTESFRKELERRFGILYTEEQIESILREGGYRSIREYIEKEFVSEPETAQPLLKKTGPVDEWKNSGR